MCEFTFSRPLMTSLLRSDKISYVTSVRATDHSPDIFVDLKFRLKLCSVNTATIQIAIKQSRSRFDLYSTWQKLNKKAHCPANLFGLVEALNLCNFVQQNRNTVNACKGRLQRDTTTVELHSPFFKKSSVTRIPLRRPMITKFFSVCERIVSVATNKPTVYFGPSTTKRPGIYLSQSDPWNFPVRMCAWKVCVHACKLQHC